MNRVVIILSKQGEFEGVASDEPIEFFVYDESCKNEPVYSYRRVCVGPDKVKKLIGGQSVAYGGDEVLIDPSPSKPTIKSVKG